MNQVVAAPNEFARELASVTETAASAVAAQAKALVEARYIVALRRPRDMDVVRERLLKECRRPSFAAVARYVKPIGKDKAKWPTGHSIRFAEAAIRTMTNITVETTTVYDDREKRILRVTVTDLESNVPYSDDVPVAKTIERRHAKEGDAVLRTRLNSYGDTLYILEATDDDILNKQRALVSKAIRTLALRLIPGDILDECMSAILQTQADADAQDPDAAKRKLFDAFGELGVRTEQLKEYLGHNADSLTPKELADLRALYAAIRDGEATWRAVMESRDDAGDDKKPQGNGASATLKDILKAKRPPAGAGTDADVSGAGTGAAAPPPTISTAPSAPLHRSFEQLLAALGAARNQDERDLVLDEARGLPRQQYDQLVTKAEGLRP